MLRCGIEEDNEALMERFLGGLNKEIQTILRYKSYHTITRLFQLACNAKCEVQDRREATQTNYSAGRSTWRSPNLASRTAAPTPLATTSMRSAASTPPPFAARKTTTGQAPSAASSMASTGKSSQI
jgi:hypothetical protein